MQKSIEILMGEHRLIEQALGSLETLAAEVRAGLDAERAIIADYASFFRGFADACHHGKEEDILFRRMIELGFPRDAGPIAVMLHEHEVGRAHVLELAQVAAGSGTLGADARLVLKSADAYVPMLRAHILKEDHVLYPMAEQVLKGFERDAMESEFDAFQAKMEADGSYDRLRALAERLTTRFRPDPERMAAAALMGHCGG